MGSSERFNIDFPPWTGISGVVKYRNVAEAASNKDVSIVNGGDPATGDCQRSCLTEDHALYPA
jgi:hypothetical protein